MRLPGGCERPGEGTDGVAAWSVRRYAVHKACSCACCGRWPAMSRMVWMRGGSVFRVSGDRLPSHFSERLVGEPVEASNSFSSRSMTRLRCLAASDGVGGGEFEVGLVAVVEEGEELVVLLLRDRVVLVVVALGAADGQAEPDGARSC